MRKIILLVLLSVGCLPAVSGNAVDACKRDSEDPICSEFERKNQALKDANLAIPRAMQAFGRSAASRNGNNNDNRGCCSYHDGMSMTCDYSMNRIICNDGQLSPTCSCE